MLKYFPNLHDPRWMQVSILAVYAIVAREVFNFERSHWITAGLLIWAISLDFVIGWTQYKISRVPIGSAVIAFACGLLIDSPHPGLYFIAVTIGVLSKSFFTYKNKHYMNPANFSVVLIFLLGSGYATGIQNLFAGYILPSCAFLSLGLLNVYYAKQLTLTLSFFAAFLLFAGVRWLLGTYWLLAFGPCLSPGFLLFTFHMLSDPATTPRSKKMQIFFSIGVAIFDAFFRYYLIPYGQFFALFCFNSLMPLLRDFEENRNMKSIVRPFYQSFGVQVPI